MTTRNIRRTKKKSKPKSRPGERDPAFEQARKRLDEKKLPRDRRMQWAHFWNLCPRCGGDMFDQRSLQICFAVCRDCSGLYIELHELELARKHHDPKKFLDALARKAKKPTVKT